MKFEDFVKALNDAGWFERSDAQYDQIKQLHTKLWPTVAQLEEQLDELLNAVCSGCDTGC